MHQNIFWYDMVQIFGISMQEIALRIEILGSPYKILLYLQGIQLCQNF